MSNVEGMYPVHFIKKNEQAYFAEPRGYEGQERNHPSKFCGSLFTGSAVRCSALRNLILKIDSIPQIFNLQSKIFNQMITG